LFCLLSPLIPEGQCDLLVALERVEGLRILDIYGNPKVMILLNTRTMHSIDVISGDATYPEVSRVISKIKELSRRVWRLNANEIALEMGDPIFSNIVMLGALCTTKVLPISRRGFESVIQDLLPSRRLDENIKAFDRGRQVVQEL
jgi:indolepyruvate ferredoxin oxidoreductase beta subunit